MSRAIGVFFFCLILLFSANFLFYSPFYYHHDKQSPYEDIHATSTTSTTSTTCNDADNHTNAGRMTRAEEGDTGARARDRRVLSPWYVFFSILYALY